MPVGLPQVSSTPQQCRIFASQVVEAWRDFLVYLDVPSTTLYWESCRTACHDVKVATTSLTTLGYLTLKPMVLILWLILQNIWTLLQFLSRHLFKHAYESAKKGWIQFKWVNREFWKWQSTLSNAQIGIELSIIAALIGCFLLRRHIEKRKYVQRVSSWYRRKKRAVKEVSVVGLMHVYENVMVEYWRAMLPKASLAIWNPSHVRVMFLFQYCST